MKNNHTTPGAQRGFSLVEAGLVLGLVMIAAVIAYGYYGESHRSTLRQESANAVVQTIAAVKRMHAPPNRYNYLTPQRIRDAKIAPKSVRSNAAGNFVLPNGAIMNIYNNDLSESDLPLAGGSMKITLWDVPKADCVTMVSTITQVAKEAFISGRANKVSNNTGSIDHARVMQLCGAGGARMNLEFTAL